MATRISSARVAQLLEQGAAYVDVRTHEEYIAGHVPGALHVPWQLGSLAGLSLNPNFSAAAQALLSPDATLVVGCHSGRRAGAAAEELIRLGYAAEKVLIHEDSWDGCRDAFGRRVGGWWRQGRPVACGPMADAEPEER